MTEWKLDITYGAKPFRLKAELEYHSAQIMRIRVHGSKSSLLLENDYPMLKLMNSKKGIKWKIREGSIGEGCEQNATLLIHIMQELEYNIKKDLL